MLMKSTFFGGTESDFVWPVVLAMGYPPVKLKEKPRHQPGSCSLPMDQQGQNGARDGPQNKNVDIVVITSITHKKAAHLWCVLYKRFQWF